MKTRTQGQTAIILADSMLGDISSTIKELYDAGCKKVVVNLSLCTSFDIQGVQKLETFRKETPFCFAGTSRVLRDALNSQFKIPYAVFFNDERSALEKGVFPQVSIVHSDS